MTDAEEHAYLKAYNRSSEWVNWIVSFKTDAYFWWWVSEETIEVHSSKGITLSIVMFNLEK